MNKNMQDFFVDGLIGHKVAGFPGQYDFGDSAARCGSYWYLLALRTKLEIDNFAWPNALELQFLEAIQKLQVSPGIWRRHNIQYSDPKDFSRDQQTPIQLALWAYNQKQVLKNTLYPQWKNFGKYQNKDFRTYEWTIDFRCLNWWWMWPIMCVLDLGLLINVLIRLIKGGLNKDDVGDDLNLTMMLMFVWSHYSTPLSFLSNILYFSLRNVQRAWDWYFRDETAPPINELARPVISAFKDPGL